MKYSDILMFCVQNHKKNKKFPNYFVLLQQEQIIWQIKKMKEINYKDMKFNPFNLIGGEWMLVTAGNEQSGCNTMTASWGHLGCL